MLTLDDFDFTYPEELVAHRALEDRAAAKLLIRKSSGEIFHSSIRLASSSIPDNALVIYNDTKVIPARIEGSFPSGGRFEIFLLNCQSSTDSESTWEIIGKPLTKLKSRSPVDLGNGLSVHLEPSPKDERFLLATFPLNQSATISWLMQHGRMPLPPYIKRSRNADSLDHEDKSRYQTVYAQSEGSVAAPTAGLHFTREVMTSMGSKGIQWMPITLHVGGGTFLPVQSQNPSDHRMHEEWYQIPRSTLQALQTAKKSGRCIVAVGTTSFRALESFARDHGDSWIDLDSSQSSALCSTNIFIFPKHSTDRYIPKIPTAMFTNFHQPKSTLFMLISALIGVKEARDLYKTALQEKYRLFSYGDSSLLYF